MSQPPLPLNPGEAVPCEDEKAIHIKNSAIGIGYNVIYGTLWLTSQRIIFQSFPLGNILTYPLSRIVDAARAEISVSHRAVRTPVYSRSTFFDAGLKLDFDNGGKEYFIPQDIAAWAQAILEAKTLAPDLPYTQAPPLVSAVEQGNRSLGVIIGILFGVILCFLCGVGGTLLFVFLLAARTQG